jgi:transposase
MNASSLAPDELWADIEPLLPEEPFKLNGGRARVPNRATLAGIIFVLRTGCAWRLLPKELGCGSGTTRGGDCANGRKRASGSGSMKRR